MNKGEWLRKQLSDLVNEVIFIERSDLPILNKGLEVKCAIDEKTEKILNNKEAAPDMYEALKALLRWAELSYTNDTGEWADENDPTIVLTKQALAKAEGKENDGN